DRVMLFALAGGQKVGAALFIFFDPSLSETAVADLCQDLSHLVARLLGDNSRSRGIVSLLCSVADGIAHVTEAAAVNQINDKLEFVEALKVGDLRLVASFRERLEARFDQFTHATAKHGLFTE